MVKIFRSRWVGVVTFAFVAFVSVFSFSLLSGKGVDAQTSFVQSILACTDSDGGTDYNVKGTVNFKNPSNGSRAEESDFCLPADGKKIGYVAEYYCNSSGAIRIDHKCPNGCKDGACIQDQPESTCIDTDGGKDYYTAGRVNTVNKIGDTVDSGAYFDTCDRDTLVERYCTSATDSVSLAEGHLCLNGCKDGACIAETPSGEEEEKEEPEDRTEQIKQIQELITGIGGMDRVIRGVNVIEKTFKTLAKQGVDTPSDLSETIARAKEINPEIVKFKNSKAENVTDEEAGTLTDNMNEMCGISSTLEDFGNRVPQFLQLGAKMKQASADLKKAKSDVVRAAKVATRSKFDISDKAEELNGAVDALKTTLDDVGASTDFDEKDYKINEFYDQFQRIYDTIGVINALQNTSKAKVEWTRRVKLNSSTISLLSKKAELDTSELVAKNDEIKAKVDELGVTLVKKPIDRYEIKLVFEDLKSLNTEFIYIADQLSGINSALPKVKVAKFDTSQFKKTGAFSQFCEPQE
ncbi:MAG: hypothetical protein AAB606_00460 [Patescibacteria group bacterium]|mgnify:CR=1 FL=1